MNNSMLTINLQEKLIAANRRVIAQDNAILAKQEALDAETEKLVGVALAKADADYEQEKTKLLQTLGLNYKLKEADEVRAKRSKWGHLPQERIFTEAAIRDLCITYNLRFLPTRYYKGALAHDLGEKVDEFKKANGGALPRFEKATGRIGDHAWTLEFLSSGPASIPGDFLIAAPAESFDLQPRPIDPILFCKLDDSTYYLVHKWGNDLSALRRWLKYRGDLNLAWPFLAAVAALISGIATVCITGNAGYTLLAMTAIPLAVFGAWRHDVGGVGITRTTDSTWNSPFRS